MAGGRSESARDAFAARDWPFAAVKVYDDIDAAHAGALGGAEGAVIIAGPDLRRWPSLMVTAISAVGGGFIWATR